MFCWQSTRSEGLSAKSFSQSVTLIISFLTSFHSAIFFTIVLRNNIPNIKLFRADSFNCTTPNTLKKNKSWHLLWRRTYPKLGWLCKTLAVSPRDFLFRRKPNNILVWNNVSIFFKIQEKLTNCFKAVFHSVRYPKNTRKTWGEIRQQQIQLDGFCIFNSIFTLSSFCFF